MAPERAILDAGQRSVFVHVRRTDYVGNPYHVVLPMEYYREAAALIAAKVPDPVFFIFSDDPEWCEANFKRSEEHTSELQSHLNLVCRLLLEKKKIIKNNNE